MMETESARMWLVATVILGFLAFLASGFSVANGVNEGISLAQHAQLVKAESTDTALIETVQNKATRDEWFAQGMRFLTLILAFWAGLCCKNWQLIRKKSLPPVPIGHVW